ncbi:GNAT family protein [Georgenia sp. H159]|uniref:GNAT family N-acetyltransferase n=1 Tax=Georgenia sp. H159 TaxID=3076115 RepID=UPI002D77B510|nr:GNAT family protein [Georgenia sp. H159]
MTSPTTEVHIRPVALEDARELAELLSRNRDYFRTGEPHRPEDYYTAEGQRALVGVALQARDAGSGTTFVIESGGVLVGRIALSSIVRGAFQSGSVGYVVDRAAAGRGVATAALRQVVDVAFVDLDLHRLQADTLPENVASQRVLHKCGFVRIGRAPHYLRIDGRWRTHDLFQLVNHNHGVAP